MKRNALGLGAPHLLATMLATTSGCGLFDDPDVGECHGMMGGTEVSLSLEAERSEYVLEYNEDVRLEMHYTDGTTHVSADIARFQGPPSSLPLTPQPFVLGGGASAWVLNWIESALMPTSGMVDLEEATRTRMRGTFVYELAGDETLQCTFDLRRSDRSASGDADWD
jgi:hypothetical protein